MRHANHLFTPIMPTTQVSWANHPCVMDMCHGPTTHVPMCQPPMCPCVNHPCVPHPCVMCPCVNHPCVMCPCVNHPNIHDMTCDMRCSSWPAMKQAMPSRSHCLGSMCQPCLCHVPWVVHPHDLPTNTHVSCGMCHGPTTHVPMCQPPMCPPPMCHVPMCHGPPPMCHGQPPMCHGPTTPVSWANHHPTTHQACQPPMLRMCHVP